MIKLCMNPHFQPICYHGDQSKFLQSLALESLDIHQELPHVLLTVPECLCKANELRRKIESIHEAGKLGRFVLDEADKVLDWGDSFRDAYIELATALREKFHSIPILALSGSATPQDIEQTMQALGRHDVVRISEPLNRPNLFYEIREKNGDHHRIVQDIKQLVKCGQGIIYCATHRDTTDLAHRLRDQGLITQVYTSKVMGEEAKNIIASWKDGKIQVIVATSAFGMGIDKNDVRWIVHHTMPPSIKDWVQETGRAGRDGKKANCIIYFDANDVRKVQGIISRSPRNIDPHDRWKGLHQMERLITDATSCRRKRLLAHLGDDYPFDNCHGCDCCVAEDSGDTDMVDVTASAIDAIKLLKSMTNGRGRNHWTKKQLGSAMKGRRCDFKPYHGWELFGCQLPLQGGKHATVTQIMCFISILIHKRLIVEYKRDVETKSGRRFCHIYVQPGPRAENFLENPYKIEFSTEITRRPRIKSPLVVRERHQGKIIDVIVIDD